MADYKVWVRTTQSGGLPNEILPLVQSDSKAAFNLWLQCKKDSQKMVMKSKRTQSRERSVARGHESLKKRDLEAKYNAEKLAPVLAALEKAKRYTFDALFPSDMEEIYYLIPKGVTLNDVATFVDSTEVEGQEEIEDGHAAALLDSTFSADAHPDIPSVDSAARDDFVTSLHDKPTTIKKVRKVPALENGTAQEIVPVPPLEKAKGELQHLSKDMSVINAAIMMLEGQEYASTFTPAVTLKKQTLDKAFRHLRHHISAKCEDEATYEKAYKVIETVMDWWASEGEKGCKAFSDTLRPSKAKGKAKAKGKTKAKAKGRVAVVGEEL